MFVSAISNMINHNDSYVPNFLSLPPLPHPMSLVHHRVPGLALYICSNFSPAISFTYGDTNMSMLFSPSAPLSPSLTESTRVPANSFINTIFLYSIQNVNVKSLSHVQLFMTPWTVAYQAPLSMGFSRQQYWSELAFPSPRDLPNPGIKPQSPASQTEALTSEPPGKYMC